MPNRRKYKKPIKVNFDYDEEKLEILKSIYGKVTTIGNLALDKLLDISYQGGKVKSDYLTIIRTEAVRIREEKDHQIKAIDDLLEGRIQAEKKEQKVQTGFKKLVTTLRKSNHLEIEDGRVIFSDRLVDQANKLSEELGISITPKMLIDEIERQEAEA